MKLIVGLGNPGPQYQETRHNAGFMVVDRLARAHGGGPVKSRFSAATVEATIAGERCLLLKPLTFMNRSGQCVAEAVRFFKADISSELLVVVDEVYLPVGRVRLLPAGGTGGHNGLQNIQQLLGTDAYPRLRVGVGVQPGGGKPPFIDQADFVLGRFTPEEQGPLDGALTRASQAAELWAGRGMTHAMNVANAGGAPVREKKPRPPTESPPAPGPRDAGPEGEGPPA